MGGNNSKSPTKSPQDSPSKSPSISFSPHSPKSSPGSPPLSPSESPPNPSLVRSESDVRRSNYFDKNTAHKLVKPQTTFEILSTDCIQKALDMLSTHRVLALLVLNHNVSMRSYMGMVSIFDILTFTVLQKCFQSENLRGVEDEEELKKILAADVSEMLRQPVVNCLGLANQLEKLKVCSVDTSLKRLLQHFSGGGHRVLLTTAADTVQIVSQTDFLRFLTQLHETKEVDLHKWRNLSINYLGAITGKPSGKKLLTVSCLSTALHAFRTMFHMRMNELAVVDMKGILIGTISASDLRGCDHAHLLSMLSTIPEFLTTVHGAAPEPICCTIDTPIGEVVDLILTRKKHKVWVVDERRKPIGVVSISDVLRTLARYLLFT